MVSNGPKFLAFHQLITNNHVRCFCIECFFPSSHDLHICALCALYQNKPYSVNFFCCFTSVDRNTDNTQCHTTAAKFLWHIKPSPILLLQNNCSPTSICWCFASVNWYDYDEICIWSVFFFGCFPIYNLQSLAMANELELRPQYNQSKLSIGFQY